MCRFYMNFSAHPRVCIYIYKEGFIIIIIIIIIIIYIYPTPPLGQDMTQGQFF